MSGVDELMRRGLLTGIGVLAAVAALAIVPAISSGGPGKLVGKDTGKGNSPLAVATATVKNPGKLTAVITSSPRKRIQWGYTTDCVRGSETSEWPPPGTYEDKVQKGPIRAKLKTGGLPNADSCRIQVSGKLTYKGGKRVTVKVFNK
jgi:hypothetical protein